MKNTRLLAADDVLHLYALIYHARMAIREVHQLRRVDDLAFLGVQNDIDSAKRVIDRLSEIDTQKVLDWLADKAA